MKDGDVFVVAENDYWSLAVTVQGDPYYSGGVHIGTRQKNSPGKYHLGLGLSDVEVDELIFRLMQLRRKRRKNNGESDNG